MISEKDKLIKRLVDTVYKGQNRKARRKALKNTKKNLKGIKI